MKCARCRRKGTAASSISPLPMGMRARHSPRFSWRKTCRRGNHEVAKSGIRVNAVAPGPTDTGMLTRFTRTAENKAALVTRIPMDRLGLAEEVADGIVFIASDEARFITGHVLNVDGGRSAN